MTGRTKAPGTDRRNRRLLVMGLTLLMPWRIRRVLYRHLLGWRLHDTAYIGRSLVDVAVLEMGPGAQIGHFNVFRQMDLVMLGAEARVGQWNWISGGQMFRDAGANAQLTMGRDSSLTSRHYLDCSGGVRIGKFTVVGGVRSTILSHQVDLKSAEPRAVQELRGVAIGDYCFISSNVCIAPGATIADRCVVGMGAVVIGALSTEGVLYAGVPAKESGRETYAGGYFARERGHGDYRPPEEAEAGD